MTVTISEAMIRLFFPSVNDFVYKPLSRRIDDLIAANPEGTI